MSPAMPDRVCETCRGAFPDPPRRGKPRRFCSDRCRPSTRWKAAAADRRKARPPKPPADDPGPPAPKNWHRGVRVPGEGPTRADAARREHAAAARAASVKPWGVDPTTSDRHYTDHEAAFLLAVERYRRERRRPFPTLSELLGVARGLGWTPPAAPAGNPGGDDSAAA